MALSGNKSLLRLDAIHKLKDDFIERSKFADASSSLPYRGIVVESLRREPAFAHPQWTHDELLSIFHNDRKHCSGTMLNATVWAPPPLPQVAAAQVNQSGGAKQPLLMSICPFGLQTQDVHKK